MLVSKKWKVLPFLKTYFPFPYIVIKKLIYKCFLFTLYGNKKFPS